MILMNDKVYDVLKWIAQIALPAIAVFWYAIADAWGLPYITEIQMTIIAVDTLLGALLGLSNLQYKTANTYDLPDREDNSDD
jgi:hypothetical protein